MVGKPLSVAPDIIPCLGPYLFSGVAGCMVWVIAFLLGAATWSFITAVSWFFYRPLVGILLLGLSAAFTYAIVHFKNSENLKNGTEMK